MKTLKPETKVGTKKSVEASSFFISACFQLLRRKYLLQKSFSESWQKAKMQP
jgi:hypothetical protein